MTSLVDGCQNFLAGSAPSIADLLALSLAASNKIGKTQKINSLSVQITQFSETAALKAWKKRLSEAGFSL